MQKPDLTAAEEDIIRQLTTGHSLEAIAKDHRIKVPTLKTKVKRLKEKFSCEAGDLSAFRATLRRRAGG